MGNSSELFEYYDPDRGFYNQEAFSIAAGLEHGMWAATGKLSFLDPWKRSPVVYDIGAKLLARSPTGLWVWETNTIRYFDLTTNSVEYELDLGDPVLMGNPILVSSSDELIFIGASKFVLVLSRVDGTVRRLDIPGNISGMASDGKNGVWITSVSGLWHLDADAPKPMLVSQLPADETGAASVPHKGLTLRSDGIVLVGLADSGIALFDPFKGEWLERLALSIDKKNGVSAIFQDQLERLWVTIYDNGLYRIDDSESTFSYINYEFDDDNDAVPIINALTLHDDKIYVATSEYKLYQYSFVDKAWGRVDTNIEKKLGPPPSTDKILSLESFAGKLWIGTFDSGLISLDLENGEVNQWYSNRAVQKLFSENDTLWAGLGHTGLIALDHGGQLYFEENILVERTLEPAYDVYDLMSNNNILYALGSKGIKQINRNTREYIKTIDIRNRAGNYDVVHAFFVESDDVIWLALEDGLQRYDHVAEKRVFFGRKEGILSTINNLVIDNNGKHLWITTNTGILLLDIQKQQIIGTFGQFHGLKTSRIHTRNALKSSSGNTYISTAGGILKFPTSIPEVRRENLGIFVSCTEGCGRDFDGLSIKNPDIVRFYMFSNDYDAGGHLRYQYKLVGHDDDWIDSASRNTVSISNLPAGSYTFRARALAPDGAVYHLPDSGPGSPINVLVTRLWWKRTDVQIYIFLAITGGLVAQRFVKSREQKKRELELINAVNERTVELEKKNQEAVNANKVKNEFLSLVTHELRSPLAIIVGTAELIMAMKKPGDDYDYNKTILTAGMHLSGMIDDLLSVASDTEHNLRLNPTESNLNSELMQIVTIQEKAASGYGKTLVYELDDRVNQNFVFDAQRFRQILLNLTNNAFKHSSGSLVRIEVVLLSYPESHRARIEFSVKDDGGNISEEDKQKIFERFRRGSNARSSGMGLGLAIASEFVRKHGGDLELVLELGRSTTFRFTLDLQMVADRPIRVVTENRSSIYDRLALVVVVDDSNEMLEITKNMVEILGFAVKGYSSGEQVLSDIENIDPDLVITDVMMSPLDGISLARKLKSIDKYKYIPIVALTAVSQTAKSSGIFDEVLSKPVTKETLAKVIYETVNPNNLNVRSLRAN